ARDGAGHIELIRVGDFIDSDDHGPERAACRVHLRLRQIERVLTLDIPGGNIVSESEAENGSTGAEYQRKFRLRRGKFGIGAQPDGLAWTHTYAGRSFEENLRPAAAVDVRVHAFSRSMLRIAKAGAGYISASARPSFHGINGNPRRRRLAMPAGQ